MSEPNANKIDIIFALDLLADAWADAKPRQVLMMAIAKITEQRSQIEQLKGELNQALGDLAEMTG